MKVLILFLITIVLSIAAHSAMPDPSMKAYKFEKADLVTSTAIFISSLIRADLDIYLLVSSENIITIAINVDESSFTLRNVNRYTGNGVYLSCESKSFKAYSSEDINQQIKKGNHDRLIFKTEGKTLVYRKLNIYETNELTGKLRTYKLKCEPDPKRWENYQSD